MSTVTYRKRKQPTPYNTSVSGYAVGTLKHNDETTGIAVEIETHSGRSLRLKLRSKASVNKLIQQLIANRETVWSDGDE